MEMNYELNAPSIACWGKSQNYPLNSRMGGFYSQCDTL